MARLARPEFAAIRLPGTERFTINVPVAFRAMMDALRPLHNEKGGPHCCLTCIGKWQGEHGRKRRTGRIAIRALMAFKDAGGSYKDIDKLTDCAKFAGMEGLFRDEITEITDQLGYMDGIARLDGSNADLTSELLADALRLVHPDHHRPSVGSWRIV